MSLVFRGNCTHGRDCGGRTYCGRSRPLAREPCGTSSLGESRVTAIEDSRTLSLADGRKIRLAGIEWGVPAETARTLLADLLLNRQVTLKAPERSEPDRYGRIYAFPIVSGSETPIQYPLLERGLVLVSGRVSDRSMR